MVVPKKRELTPRDEAVLRIVVERFIERAEPVASQALSDAALEGKKVSSATIRNTMAKLEQLGFLEQPHTSAGRVPTAAGLKLYVDALMSAQVLSPREVTQIETKLWPKVSGQSVYTAASKGLAELVAQVAVCVSPRLPTTVLDTIELVRAAEKRLVVLCVTRAGTVHHKLIELEQDMDRPMLERMNQTLRETFSGLSLIDIRARLAAELHAERARYDAVYRQALELTSRGVPDVGAAEVSVEGTAHALKLESDQLRTLLRAVEEKRLLLSVLERMTVDGVSHVEVGVQELEGLSVVAAPFGAEGGVLAVVGPARMNYARLVPVVAYCATAMTKHLGVVP